MSAQEPWQSGAGFTIPDRPQLCGLKPEHVIKCVADYGALGIRFSLNLCVLKIAGKRHGLPAGTGRQ